MVFEKKTIDNAITWNQLLLSLPNPHILQVWQWGEVKQHYGWRMHPTAWFDKDTHVCASGMVLTRSLRFGRFETGLKIGYIPRGPVLDWGVEQIRELVLVELETLARSEKVISLKMDPEVLLGIGVPGSMNMVENEQGTQLQEILRERGWQYSSSQIQFRNTSILDLSGSEEEWLARMKQKTRYNIRLATRKNVTVRIGYESDIPVLYRMYLETSIRDGFVIRSEDYYSTVWRKLLQDDLAKILIAMVGNEIVAGLILFHFGQKAWYFYGMSSILHREKMPNYLIQWEAMKTAKRLNCKSYDLWGVPEIFDESDSMWGVFRFKEGFGGEVKRSLGAWDFIPRKGLNALFTRIVPQILSVMRHRRVIQAKHEAN